MLGAASLRFTRVAGWISFLCCRARSLPDVSCNQTVSHSFSPVGRKRGRVLRCRIWGLEPYLNMEMRLGEGSGAALAMPIIEAACAIYNNMGELAASNIVLPGNTTSDLNS